LRWDSAGEAYVTGYTTSSDFPVTAGALQTIFKGGGLEGNDAFVTKLSADGSTLVYSTYLGGSLDEEAHGIALDSSGNAWVTGTTSSFDFPVTSGALQRTPLSTVTDSCYISGDCGHAFISKLDPKGAALLYSSYLSGTGADFGQAVAVDSSGNAYVAGSTISSDFPTTPGSFQTGHSQDPENAFVTKFSAQGTLLYSTYLGGDNGPDGNEDAAFGVAVDSSGSAYVTGGTDSTNFPTANAFESSLPSLAGGFFESVFVTKLHPAGCALIYSTYLGGSTGPAVGNAIAVDSSGNAFISGQNFAQDFPVANAFEYFCSFCNSYGGNIAEPFVAEFDPSGSKLVFSSFLAGSNSDLTCFVGKCAYDQGRGIAVDSAGNTYVTGQTLASDFPTQDAVQPVYGGDQDVFVTKISPVNVPTVSVTPSQLAFPAQAIGTTSSPQVVTLTNQSSSSVKISSISLEYPDSQLV
jgi:hypothetical protein